nr:Fur family transcriptional regulator [uncultured Cohaesibacter sp.]
MSFKEDTEKICKEHALWVTAPRKTILEVISASNDYPDANEIFCRACKIDSSIAISTVYRTLKLFEEKGILDKHFFGNGPARFTIAKSEHYDHFVDLETGHVTEFRSEQIKSLQEEIASKFGFKIEGHKLEIYVRPIKSVCD